ncbi:MAG: 6,7-dimethyl-8-ribityllumazine synthase [Acidobacteria bacterium]|nr:6,7-dimethyl-8-ribityllumazine synthase [Acidobacteriota bacterium]MCA1611912.1 6,7-dimethyl-8-ribityllumazine synthase [Acidobacteriota bacterium]
MNSRRVVRRTGPALFAREVEGESDASKLRITVVCARWNPTVTDALLSSALGALSDSGAKPGNVTVVRVPGAFELPAASRLALASKTCDAVVALGAIVRGETTHHEVLGNAVGAALASLSAETGRPIGFGLLTCQTMEQARARTGKGAEAAEAAVEMANLLRRMRAS